MKFFVYIMTNKPFGTLYIGVTSNLGRRVYEHNEGLMDGFTKKYELKTLVYAEEHPTAESAITREKCMKKWKRNWKLRLICEANPSWRDLSGEIF